MQIRNKNKILEKDNLFFTSDTHFYHNGIINFCDRPYYNANEMNEDLIKRWNEVVPLDGIIYHLGDFAFTSNVQYVKDIIQQLNGTIHLIYGNHDYQNKLDRVSISSLFESTCQYIDLYIKDDEVTDGIQKLFLCHYPMLSWAGSERGSWNLHGHIHSKPDSYKIEYNPKLYDVGVDANNFTPISYEEVKIKITQQCLLKNS